MHVAGAGFEVALVARAVPALLVGLVVDDAAEMGALLAERDDLGVGQADEDRGVVVARDTGTGRSRRPRRQRAA